MVFGINNDINAVREKSEFGAAPPPPATLEPHALPNMNGFINKKPRQEIPGIDSNIKSSTLPGLSI